MLRNHLNQRKKDHGSNTNILYLLQKSTISRNGPNGNYPSFQLRKWMEEARISYMDQMGFSYRKVEELGVISPVVNISVSYKKQVSFDNEIQIRVSVKKYNSISLEFNYEFFNASKNEICTIASSRHCFLKEGKLISLKKEIPDLDRAIISCM